VFFFSLRLRAGLVKAVFRAQLVLDGDIIPLSWSVQWKLPKPTAHFFFIAQLSSGVPSWLSFFSSLRCAGYPLFWHTSLGASRIPFASGFFFAKQPQVTSDSSVSKKFFFVVRNHDVMIVFVHGCFLFFHPGVFPLLALSRRIVSSVPYLLIASNAVKKPRPYRVGPPKGF